MHPPERRREKLSRSGDNVVRKPKKLDGQRLRTVGVFCLSFVSTGVNKGKGRHACSYMEMCGVNGRMGGPCCC